MEVELHRIEPKYLKLRIVQAKRQSRLLASLAEHGQQEPAMVVAAQLPGRYVLIDGYRRFVALRTLSEDQLAVNVMEMTETQALLWRTRSAGETRASALEHGWLVRELVAEHGMTVREVGEKLGRSPGWVSRQMTLVDLLGPKIHKAVREGRICPWGASRSLAPLARANKHHCETLVEHLGKTGASARQLGRLYEAWKKADAEGKERLVQEPHLYLDVERKASGRCDLTDMDKTLANDLVRIARIAHRTRTRLVHRQGSAWPKALQGAWQKAQEAFASLKSQVEEKINAGS